MHGKHHPPNSAGQVSIELFDRRPEWMLRGHLQRKGREGEEDTVKKSVCPECGSRLVLFRDGNTPLFDAKCTNCNFMAQIKTSKGRPKTRVTGAGYSVLRKWLDSGNPVPPLIVNSRWETGQQIRLYKDIPESHIKPRKLSPNHRYAGYEMFTYVRLDRLQYKTLYLKSD